MQTRYLFPHYFKKIGWVVLIPGLVLGFLTFFYQYQIPGFQISIQPDPKNPNNIHIQYFSQSLALALVIMGVMFVAFAKEKFEDELTAAIRRNALYWSILINYSLCGILMIAAIITSDVFYNPQRNLLGSFGNIIGLSMYNLFSTLIFFLLRYHYLLYSKRGEYKLGKLSFLPYYPYRSIGQYVCIILFVLFLCSNKAPLAARFWSEIVVLLSFSLLTLVFSRQKHEDELVTNMRMESMQLALYFNYSILLLADIFIYGNAFFYFMIFNLFSVQIFFLIRFQFVYNKLMRELKEAKA